MSQKTFENQILLELRFLREDALQIIENGVDRNDYRYWVGYLKALRDSTDKISDVSKKSQE